MRSFFVSIALLITLALGILATSVNAQTFNINLTIGSRGADVVSLQQFLVAKGFLQMPLGVTYGYFGPLTRAAVARWQTANGITPPAGFFGPISRAAIAAQIGSIATSSASAPVPAGLFPNAEIDTPTALGMRAGQVILFRAFPFEVRPGGLVTLDGSSFSKTLNKVYFNGGNPVVATSTNGVTLEVPVPFDLSEGEYNLSVSNTWGSSVSPDITVVIKITSNPKSEPIIESASIIGDTVTLIGDGFASSNNIITTFGNSPGMIPASGDMLTFRLTDLSFYNQIKNSTLGQKYQTTLWIYIQNEYGINKDPYKLDIII